MNKKRNKLLEIIIYPIIFVGMIFIIRIFNDLNWIWTILISFGITLLIYLDFKFKWIKETNKEEENRTKTFVKTLDTLTLRQAIQIQKDFIEIAEKEYGKRKDRKLRDKIGEQFWNIIDYSMGIFLFALIMFGGIPIMFGVNNEFTNPSFPYNFTNSSALSGATNGIELVGHAAQFTLITLMNLGKENPQLWFWLFWLAVVSGIILPLIKIIYFIGKSILK